MPNARLFLLTALAMIAFAGNSLLCRLALKETSIDASSFTLIRVFSGALILCLIALGRQTNWRKAGNWPSALAFFTYAAAFSFAYVTLPAGTGALLLFGAVQATMILWGLHKGEQLGTIRLAGFALAVAGLILLVLPGISAPSFQGSILMISAGIAWGVYSLRGKSESLPAAATTGNFVRALPFACVLSLVLLPMARLDSLGITYAFLSGAITSGLGYVVWYGVLPSLKAASAATVQLSVPVLAAGGGMLLLGEPFTLRFLFSAAAILGGIALVVTKR